MSIRRFSPVDHRIALFGRALATLAGSATAVRPSPAGNLMDRFRLGYVQDFLYIGYGPIGTNIFNIADAVVMAGLGILLVKNFMNYRAGQAAEGKAATPAP